jgi:tetratricopeptide (TPR) repeat protein
MVSDVPLATGPESVGYVPPLKVGSLAERQGSAGLRTLLGSAEKLMSGGRYASAADRYQAAMRFAPRDPSIQVACAQADLAAGFFARAETGLRRAVGIDASVLNAQYDLRKAWGDKRVDQVVADLKRIATEDKTSAMPVTLLAYLAYNGGDEGRAAELLKEAATRSPGDELVAALRSHWLPDGTK